MEGTCFLFKNIIIGAHKTAMNTAKRNGTSNCVAAFNPETITINAATFTNTLYLVKDVSINFQILIE
jgi:hypothetical protein